LALLGNIMYDTAELEDVKKIEDMSQFFNAGLGKIS
jgi:hypothetical protein